MNDQTIKKYHRNRIIYLSCFFILIPLSFWILFHLISAIGYDASIISSVIILLDVLVVVFSFYRLYSETDEIKAYILNHLIHSLFNEKCYYDKNKDISELEFRNSRFIEKYTYYHSKGCLFGSFDNQKRFLMSDIMVSKDTGTDTASALLFDGIFCLLEKGYSSNDEIMIVPDFTNKFLNQISSGISKMKGTNNIVRLENMEFERYFEVYSNNQIEARKIVTVSYMEKLLELRKRIGKSITIIYKRNRAYLFIYSCKMLSTKKIILHGATQKIIEETLKTIKQVYDLLDAINE